jgi:hypothetical protein
VSPVVISCCMRLLILIGKIKFTGPSPYSVWRTAAYKRRGMLFVSSFAKCGDLGFHLWQTVVSRICCGHFCNGIRPQFHCFHNAALVSFFLRVFSNFSVGCYRPAHVLCRQLCYTLMCVTSGRGAPKSEFRSRPRSRKPPITGCALRKRKHGEW